MAQETNFPRQARIACACLLGLWVALPVSAGERITFPEDQQEIDLRATLSGAAAQDYLIHAETGQILCATLLPDVPTTAFFHILAPGSTDAIYNSATDGSEAVLSLLANGDYTIRVFLTGTARDSDQEVPYTLTVMLN